MTTAIESRVLEPAPFRISWSRREVSQPYRLVHEAASDTATVRAVFAIDPRQNIRAIVLLPDAVGRSVDELIRIFEQGWQ